MPLHPILCPWIYAQKIQASLPLRALPCTGDILGCDPGISQDIWDRRCVHKVLWRVHRRAWIGKSKNKKTTISCTKVKQKAVTRTKKPTPILIHYILLTTSGIKLFFAFHFLNQLLYLFSLQTCLLPPNMKGSPRILISVNVRGNIVINFQQARI